MKKYFIVALVAGALLSFGTASAINCAKSADKTLTSELIIKKGDKKKDKKNSKKGEATKKSCEGKTGGSGCCAGSKKTS